MRSDEEKPNVEKIFLRIGEVAKILGVDPSVIRYWETAYPGVRPRRSKTGQRVYSQKDLRRLEQIKKLRYLQGYTTQGTRQALRRAGLEAREPNDPLVVENDRMRQSLTELRACVVAFLEEIEQEGSTP